MASNVRVVVVRPWVLAVGVGGLVGLIVTGFLAVRPRYAETWSETIACGSLIHRRHHAGLIDSVSCSSEFDAVSVAVITLFVASLLMLTLAIGVHAAKVRVKVPVHRGERVNVRGPRRSDSAGVDASVDTTVSDEMGWSEVESRSVAQAVRQQLPAGLRIIEERSTERVAGVISAIGDPSEPSCVRIGLWMGPQHRGRGLMTEALRMVVDELIGNGGPVRAETAVDNISAQRVLEHAGLTVEGQRRVRLPNGTTVDGLIYSRYPIVAAADPAPALD